MLYVYLNVISEMLSVCQAAQRAGWLPVEGAEGLPKAKHVGFGLVLGTDGKRFRTRSTEVVRLVDLLDEAKERSKQGLIDRGQLFPLFLFSFRMFWKMFFLYWVACLSYYFRTG